MYIRLEFCLFFLFLFLLFCSDFCFLNPVVLGTMKIIVQMMLWVLCSSVPKHCGRLCSVPQSLVHHIRQQHLCFCCLNMNMVQKQKPWNDECFWRSLPLKLLQMKRPGWLTTDWQEWYLPLLLLKLHHWYRQITNIQTLFLHQDVWWLVQRSYH